MLRRPAPWRPLIVRTGGSVREAAYGLILALSVIAVSREYGHPSAGQVAADVLVTAVVFWLAHVYAELLAAGATGEAAVGRTMLAQALRHEWSIVAVVVPLLVVLALGALGVLSDGAAISVAVAMAVLELTAAGAYVAISQGAPAARVVLSAAVSAGMGLLVVALKALVH